MNTDRYLRFKIDKALNEADIIIAFLRRDINLDATQPLHVDLCSAKGSPVTDESSAN
jgi:hypothetical protein